MKYGYSIVLLFACLVLLSCKPEHRNEGDSPVGKHMTTIKWDGEHRLDKATYYINNVKVGVGLKGFNAIIQHISGLEIASSVKIYMPKEWSEMGYDGKVNLWWEFPFESYPDKEEEFTELCGKKSIHLSFETF